MEAKLVKDLMEAYASVYAQPEEVIVESDCECEDEEKTEKETPEMNGKKKEKKKEEVTEAKRIAHGTGKKVMPSAEERSALAKKARAGKDIGKPGKGFEKVAEKAAKQYGSKEAGERVAAAAMFKAQAKEEVETDLFDVILEYLVAEGYADTNQAALAIMANMSEEWKESIVEQLIPKDKDLESPDYQRAKGIVNKGGSGNAGGTYKGDKPGYDPITGIRLKGV